MTIICDISALEFHRTPPLIARQPLPRATVKGPPARMIEDARRRNAPTDAKTTAKALAGPLKGVSLPVHAIAPTATVLTSPYIAWHYRGEPINPSDLLQLDDDLYVTSPSRTLLDLARSRTLMSTALLLFEFLGIHAVAPKTQRSEMAADLLEEQGLISQHMRRRIFAYRHESGVPLDFASHRNAGKSELLWEPCYQKDGTRSDLWKRPPMLDVESVLAYARSMTPSQGATRLARACSLALPGSASPAESLFALMFSAPRKLGGEGMPAPQLNRMIRLGDRAARALGHPWCVGDATWEKPRGGGILPCCVEVDGRSFHGSGYADAPQALDGRDDRARENALRGMGIEVVSLTYSQMANTVRWDEAMRLILRALDLDEKPPTPAFLRQRARLRQELFGRCPPASAVGS